MPSTRRASKAVVVALDILKRLMLGEQLDAKSYAASISGIEYAAVKRIFNELEETVPGVAGEGKRDRVLRFDWPTRQRARATTVRALAVSRELMSPINGSELDNELRQLIDHMRGRLEPGARLERDLARSVFSHARAMNMHGVNYEVVDLVAQAVTECTEIEGTYRHFHGGEIQVWLRPYSIIFGDEGLYCYGECVDCDEERHVGQKRLYNIVRLSDVTMTNVHFTLPSMAEYPGREIFKHCFGIFLPGSDKEEVHTIKIAFRRKWFEYLKMHRWHHSQSQPELIGDEAVVRFELFLTLDLVRWIWSFGPDVSVVAPARLAEWVRNGEDPSKA